MSGDDLGLFGDEPASDPRRRRAAQRPDPRRRNASGGSAADAAGATGSSGPGDGRRAGARSHAGESETGQFDRIIDAHRHPEQRSASQAAPAAGADEAWADGHPDDHDADLERLRRALTRRSGSKHQIAPPSAKSLAARERRAEREAAQRRRAVRRRRSVLIALLVMALIVGGLVVWFVDWRGSETPVVRDYAGTGDTEVIVRIVKGAGLAAKADALATAGVVASAEAFSDSAANDADVEAVQPGFYKMRQHSSAASAADQLVDPANRVGKLRIIPGRQLADVTTGGSGQSVIPGYLSDIAKAACVPLNGKTDCVTVQQLAEVARTVPAAKLGVPEWAVTAVGAAPDPDRRLEGLLMPGDYDVPPGVSATDLMTFLFTESTTRWNATDITTASKLQNVTPYQAVVIASIVQREGITDDMPMVARVIYNRLQIKKKLEMDSTVNYALNRAQIATSNADRSNPSPYNTYLAAALPPTPISSPGPQALDATDDPAPGKWLYFVKVDPKTNASCFSVTDAEHEACVNKARANGVFDG